MLDLVCLDLLWILVLGAWCFFMNDQLLLPDPLAITRRQFFARTTRGLGTIALANLLPTNLLASTEQKASGGAPGFPNFPAKAKRIIYLFQSGAPSQMDLFDYKPLLNKLNGEQLPEHVRGGQRLPGMPSQQASIPLAGSIFKFG